MSIAGFFSFCRRRPPSLLAPLAALGRPGSKKGIEVRLPNLALGGCNDSQTLRQNGSSGEFASVFWGRLHNRSEILNQLHLGSQARPSDCELLFRAYQHWGLDFLDYFTGEFCCALWINSQQRLILGRDHIGHRPLVYHLAADGVFFAAEAVGLMAFREVPRAAKEVALLHSFLGLKSSPESTTLDGIQSVLPGHVFVAENGKTFSHRYWRPDEKKPVHHWSDEECAQKLHDALELAVRRQIPATGTVVSQLSAGLDSSTITALAAKELAKQGRNLIAVTAVPQKTFSPGDTWRNILWNEGPLAATVAKRYPNIEHILLPNNQLGLTDSISTWVRRMDACVWGGANIIWIHAIEKIAEERHANTLLSARMGNLTATFDGYPLLFQLLESGRLGRLANQILGLKRRGFSLLAIFEKLFSPYCPVWFRNLTRQIAGKEREKRPIDVMFIRPEYIRCLGLDVWINSVETDQGKHFRGESQSLRKSILARMDNGLFFSSLWRETGIWECDPMSDKDLVELCFQIPDEQFLYHGEPRSLIRRAMKDVLPIEILSCKARGVQAADKRLTIAENLPDIRAQLDRFEQNALVSQMIDIPRMRQYFDSLTLADRKPGSLSAIQDMGALRTLGVGMFICHLEGSND